MGTYFTLSAPLLLEMMAALTVSMIYILNNILTSVYMSMNILWRIFLAHIEFPKGSTLMLQTQAHGVVYSQHNCGFVSYSVNTKSKGSL